MSRRDGLVVFAAAMMLFAIAIIWIAPAGLDRAPNVTFKTLAGEHIPLQELQGQPVLITFWATTCPSCIREIPHLIALHEEYREAGLEIFGVAMAYDPPDQVLEFARVRELPYRVALDIDGAVARGFGDVMLTPTTFLVDPAGRVVVHKIGEFDTDDMRRRISRMLAES